MILNEAELKILKSKKIVRDNLLRYNKELVAKLDSICIENNISFSESVYLNINNISIPLCANCNMNRTNFISVKKGYKKYCSTKCSNSHIDTKNNKEEIYLKKYGVTNPSFNDEVKKKISEKNKNQSENTKNKREKTNLEKYGYKSNVVNPFFYEKRTNSILDPKTNEKRKKTNLEKYGVDNPLKSNIIKTKFRKTNLEKWGEEHFKKSDAYKELYLKRHINKLNNFHNDIIIQKMVDGVYHSVCNTCNNNFEISTNAFNIRKNRNLKICTFCNPVEYNISLLEKDLLDYIKSVYNNTIKSNDRKIGFELDILIPNLNLGIEFNGIYWHSEFFKENNYHYNKYKKCIENNIELIQIWEDDWLYKKDIIKSIILNKLKLTPNKIWARKCELKEVSDKLSKVFLENNHIQGWCVSSKRIGLFYDNELVSLMTFGKLRKSLGQNNKENEWELLRFCNKLNTSVAGGASKILKHFIKNNLPTNIISYSRNDYSIGKLYKTLGFIESGNNISYYWVVDNLKRNRWNFRKDKLVKMGYDSNKTEIEIMHELKSYRIFDSGNTKWILNL
jgi:hypothetical protein